MTSVNTQIQVGSIYLVTNTATEHVALTAIRRRRMIDEVTKYGEKYLSPSCCTYGDYGGSSSVGVANVRTLLEEFKDEYVRLTYRQWENLDKWNDQFTDWQTIDEFKVHGPPKVVHLTGGYGSNTVWLLECEETKDIISCLADYPVLDDDMMGRIEIEWEEEAWEGWLRADLYRELDEDLQEAIDDDKITDAKLFEAYRLAMQTTNTYPTPEHAGVHVDVDRISDAYCENVRTLIT